MDRRQPFRYAPERPTTGKVRVDRDSPGTICWTRKTFLHADSQGTSTVLCGDDLKSKLGSLPAEPILRTPDGVSFRLVKDALVVGLLCAQQVVNDSGQFVRRGCDRLGSAELARDASEELAEIVFSVVQ